MHRQNDVEFAKVHLATGCACTMQSRAIGKEKL
jgi:hypothetical protein